MEAEKIQIVDGTFNEFARGLLLHFKFTYGTR